jgi:hypothetical protein
VQFSTHEQAELILPSVEGYRRSKFFRAICMCDQNTRRHVIENPNLNIHLRDNLKSLSSMCFEPLALKLRDTRHFTHTVYAGIWFDSRKKQRLFFFLLYVWWVQNLCIFRIRSTKFTATNHPHPHQKFCMKNTGLMNVLLMSDWLSVRQS